MTFRVKGFQTSVKSCYKKILPYFTLPQQKMQTIENQLFALISGGELGIRTPGPVTVNSFQDCRNRPLCQLSGAKVRVEFF